ncbi:hypothetical protein I3843_09G191600 [Carya illinoinensis]|uniref:B-like cyclin n=1 Tax=Carya illinoinensis TaxID=32201 RepID=A0A8T1PPQ5_CARIL|nr:putative cyclin-D7-1 [Carya illinoinensis]KAG2690615.1 hypothetical protein I3760_09G195400 [Carya illinoinensis]KAG6643227.1 hypothetical protein CIPAW_09G195800 [Carya illinoinensis]KAG7964853.1 hypothetical protein I3843_09G191600 [Carya illinoinensis]
MEINLLCEERWQCSPATPVHHHATKLCSFENYSCGGSFYMTKEDAEQALVIYLEKEISFIPAANYVEHLRSKNLTTARSRATQWLFRTRNRLNLSFGAAFLAVNYLDRVLSMNECNGWKEDWMVELLSVACFSVASKFSETCTLTLHEIQMEDLGHSFQSSTIQLMELALLEALGWCLGSTTAYSCTELLLWSIDSLKPQLHEECITRVTKLLVGAVSDSRFLEFRPSVVAASALCCSLDELVPSKSDAHLSSITRLLNQAQKDDLVKCHRVMEAQKYGPLHNLIHYYDCPPSPTTVLQKQPIDIYECHVDFCFLKTGSAGPNSIYHGSSTKKRKREEK